MHTSLLPTFFLIATSASSSGSIDTKHPLAASRAVLPCSNTGSNCSSAETASERPVIMPSFSTFRYFP
uniref:Putative secreted peptide n=1 Tax=Anopheles braziliensis TaxID=58242 RepID=A0A2M3ZVQ7_9DIPT